MPERAFAQVEPAIAARVLDEDHFVHEEFLGELAFGPAGAGDSAKLVHFVTLEILRERDVRMVRIRLVAEEAFRVQGIVHVLQLVMAAADLDVNHVGDWKNIHMTHVHFKGLEERSEGLDSFPGGLWCGTDGTGRQDCHVGTQKTVRN